MKNITARTSHRNTPETDSQEFVFHIVGYTDADGKNHEIELLARDPMDAIQQFRAMDHGGLNYE